MVGGDEAIKRSGLVRLFVGGALYAAAFVGFMLVPPSARATVGPFVPMTGLVTIGFAATGMHRVLWRGRAARDQVFAVGRGLASAALTFASVLVLSMAVGLGVGVVHGFTRVVSGSHP